MNIFIIQSIKKKAASQVIFLLIIALIFGQCTSADHITNDLVDVVGHSNFIFAGTIIQMNASNIKIKATSNTAIVRIDTVIDAPYPFEKMNGIEITVVLSDSIHSKGEQQVFYSNGWYYGKTLGVKEVRNTLNKKVQPDLKKQILAARTRIADDSLLAILNRSSLIIQGTVLQINIDSPKIHSISSEHDPEFRRAVIEVDQVLKGKTNAKSVSVYYASSNDVAWYYAAKFSNNMKEIFILDVDQLVPFYKLYGFSLLDPRGIQPLSQINKIANLLKK